MLKKPSLKKPFLKIFPEQKKLVNQGKCPLCSKEIREEDFKNDLSKKEYSISGICQVCQNEIFGRGE
jgi:DNA repair exonuclease SbcCD ATPase subunit